MSSDEWVNNLTILVMQLVQASIKVIIENLNIQISGNLNILFRFHEKRNIQM